jgi:hypothetical protein
MGKGAIVAKTTKITPKKKKNIRETPCDEGVLEKVNLVRGSISGKNWYY